VPGSPILQGDKLIGAITHVFINDSKKGYAIFAENMLETAQSVAEGSPLPQTNEQLKDAS
jgi:stage IV sporulation protein B